MQSIFRLASILGVLFFVSSCTLKSNGQASQQPIRIGFYNVENLFDTVDDPEKHDEEFTPSSKLKWTEKRYRTKLTHIDEVVSGMDYPTLIGLAEVENAKVLTDLCQTTSLADRKYQFVHFESPDYRGIDVALLYQKKKFKVVDSEVIRLDFPESITPDIKGYTSRDILVVEGFLPKKQKVYVIVTHLPSRRGGLKESEPKRTFVAGHIRKKVDEIMAAEPKANVIIMGDMNDETNNKSIAITLQAHKLSASPAEGSLYNCFSKLDEAGKGSYNYKGNWNMLDQIILSGHFFQPDSRLQFQDANIYKEDYLMYNDKKFGSRPNRTYGGPNYYGGYSDHLPVYIDLSQKK